MQDQMTLRRRARRRLVGAVAIALAAVLILPMLFDPEPKPLGPDVDIRIPAQGTPFEPMPTAPGVAPPPAANEPPAQTAEPTLSPPVAAPAPAAIPEAAKPAALPVAKPDAKADQTVEKPGDKAAENKVEKKPEKAAEKAPPLPKPTGAFASQGFYLQLGAFSSESNAKQLIEKIEAAGFKVGLADSNGQYRVRLGPIADKQRALEMQARLKAKGFSSVMLGP